MTKDTINIAEQLVSDGILNQAMLNLLTKSVWAGLSVLVCAPVQDDVESFLSTLVQVFENIPYPGFMICHTNEDNQTLIKLDSSKVLGHLYLRDYDFERLTNFQKIGHLMLHPVSQENGFTFLQALLRGNVVAGMEASDAQDALSKISKGICQRVTQIDEREALRWITEHLSLIVWIKRDENGKMRLEFLDVGQFNSDENTLPYIYRFTPDGTFATEVETVSFIDRLREVGEETGHE